MQELGEAFMRRRKQGLKIKKYSKYFASLGMTGLQGADRMSWYRYQPVNEILK
jgi:hypothetical protein